MKLIYLKSAFKFDSFDVTIGIKIPFFWVSVTIEPGCSLLQFVTTNCLTWYIEGFYASDAPFSTRIRSGHIGGWRRETEILENT